ncbi:PadR family transcriptional regulator [Kineococcus indalonis]|uniref:PadR family transcriptional regulator n=1 Tax=Kineococcus indalonis TaxID=2696566 RepID=UPI0014136877|nr:PadR family transcriptional regulator [Kineococcus indalonis]NAZ88262.1 PadR family transcriptional regulator [Kineococcus indalonis]
MRFDKFFDAPDGPGPRRGGHRGHHPGGPGPGPFGRGGPRGFEGPEGYGFGPGFGGFGGFGAGWPFGGHGRGGRGRRPRGDVRAAVLVLLAEGPSNGYRIIGEVERRSGGAWKPSPGSVYPTLQQLQDEGLIAPDPADAKRFSLTEDGRRHVQEHLADAPAPWESVDGPPSREEFKETLGQLRQIVVLLQQVAVTGRADDVRAAGDALERCRQELLGVLARDPRRGRGGSGADDGAEDQEDAG